MTNDQHGPNADTLAELVPRLRYKSGWTFRLADIERPTEHLAGSAGLTLCIAAMVIDSSSAPVGNDVCYTRVEHWFAVPTAEYDSETWQRWVFDCVLQVETHEAMEFFGVETSVRFTNGSVPTVSRPFFPAHGQGRNPYAIERNLHA